MTDQPGEEPDRHRSRERLLAPESKGAMGQEKLARRVVLGILALSALMFYLVREMGVDLEALRGYALASLFFVAIVIVCGALVGGVIALVRYRR